MSAFIFDSNQLSRLFPYYLLINEDLTIAEYGTELNKIIHFPVQSQFADLFTITEQGNEEITKTALSRFCGRKINLNSIKPINLVLYGNLEYSEAAGQFLFLSDSIKFSDRGASGDIAFKEDEFPQLDDKFYEKVLNGVPADIVVFDTHHVYRFLNPKAIKDPELRKWMIGKTDEDYCRERNKPMSIAIERRAHFNEVMQTKQLKTWEEKVTNPDGSTAYLLRNMHPVLNKQNDIEFIIGYGIDITERKHIEEQLKINEKRYHDLYEFSPALIYTHDPEGKMLSVNPAICTVLGYEPEEIVNKNIKQLLPIADRDKLQDEYLDKVNAEGVSKGIFRINHKNGGIQYLLYQNYRVEEKDAAPYIIGFSQDITERIKAERELLLAKHTSESIARVKETFLANMSHEIRTPINGIMGVTNLLTKTHLDEQQRNYANLISKSVNNLLNIINDILDLEKIGSGKIEFENQAFKVVDKVWSTIQLFQYQAQQKNLNLVFKNNLPANLVIIGDQFRLAQILSNLLSNAIKFTPVGAITVNLSLIHYSDTDVIIEFVVKDTGIGINENRLGVIFDPFVQAASNTTREFGGTGLGLSICKSLIEMQGGNINLSSKVNEGTTFVFNLPFKRGMQHMIHQENQEDMSFAKIGKKILVAEDIELNQFLVKTMLESWGCEVDIAITGAQALQKVKENDYDLILMDIQMPEMDGIVATKLIRQLPEPQKNSVSIIAFTANALKGDSKKYLEIGMDDYIIKPYTEEKLHRKIIDVLRAKGKLSSEIFVNIKNNHPVQTPEIKENIIKDHTPPTDQPRLYNTSTIESISKDNPAFLEKMIAMFVDIVAKDFNVLKVAAANNDWHEVGQIAHKLKSTLGNMGVTSLLPYIVELEAETGDKVLNVKKLDEGLMQVMQQMKADYHHIF